jgi:hypothetical protein
MKKFLIAVAGMLLLGCVQMPIADKDAGSKSTQKLPADVTARIKDQLVLRYRLAKTTLDGGDINAAGAVLELLKDNLVMNRVYMAPKSSSLSSPVQNVYENGAITQMGLMGSLSKINAVLSVLANSEAMSRTFIHGEKFWVTEIALQPDGIVFHLMSDPIENARYHGTLLFPFAKGDALAVDHTSILIADVIATDTPTNAGDAVNIQEPPMEEPPPPPRPTDSPPKTIALGQTKDKVVTMLGQPNKIVKLNGKETYYYPGVTVIFVKNKVTNVQ